ncbi:MAG: Zn-dependent exopeptidase M28 [Oscillospiraceae bacterium]|nr:Zn-dependent exopeptidase M28 [Oscillospiraceae bacterium]
MDIQKIKQIFDDTAYVRMGGTEEELRCAEYLVARCAEFGCTAQIEPFAVDRARIQEATLTVDGREIPCIGYFNAGSGTVEAPLYYLTTTDPYSLTQCKGKIVLIDGYLGYWRYQDMLDNGAVGFITYSGDVNYDNNDIDQRELRSYVSKGKKIPGVDINVKDAVALVNSEAKIARIHLVQEEWEGESRNVVLDLPGELDEYIVMTAHYDSTSLSQGAYDNMSGSVGLLGVAEHYAKAPHRYGLRFIWCGSEERGLLGSKAWVASHEEDVKKVALNVNLDMIGCIMGKFIACVTGEEKLCNYIEYFGQELGFGIAVRQDVYSSDSTPFADAGVPAVSFARLAPGGIAPIHCRYDTQAVMKAEQMAKDIDFIQAFMERMANAHRCPVKKTMPENMKEKLDEYLARKRPKNA